MTSEGESGAPPVGATQFQSGDFSAQRAAVLLAQANQRLSQEGKIFEQQLEHAKKVARLQRCIGWVVAFMLPSVAIVCVVIFFLFRVLPVTVVTAASGAFFADVVSAIIAAFKGLMPTRINGQLAVTTRDPFDSDGVPAPPGMSEGYVEAIETVASFDEAPHSG